MANRSSDSYDGGANYRNDGEARQVLEKANFDLKMKVFYLEESLKNSSKNDDGASDEARSENESLRYQLQDKNVELDQRNVLLGKAKKAMEGLKSQIEFLKSQDSDRSRRQNDLEERTSQLKLGSEQMEVEYKKQLSHYEAELLACKHAVSSKELQCGNAESANVGVVSILRNYIVIMWMSMDRLVLLIFFLLNYVFLIDIAGKDTFANKSKIGRNDQC